MDFVDVDSDKWRQYARRAKPPMKWVYAREAERLLDFDRKVAVRADASLFVSDAEAGFFKSLIPEADAKIHAISNGIDCAYFSPLHTLSSPFQGAGPHLVFTGTMDYRPNIDAVCWFAADIFPRVRNAIPAATFTIVGAKPTRQVEELAGQPGIRVTGRVPDVRPYLAHATAIVAPLRIARGIQNKILEGMAMAKPVVTTAQGLEGIEATPGRDVLVADTVEAFVAAVREAVKPEAQEIGRAARRLMEECYTWKGRLALLDQLVA
jgi:sugar transferase (PEP-CTERM/EpsH1 system associated)